MRTISQIQRSITICQTKKRQAETMLNKYTQDLSDAKSLEDELNVVIPLVEKIRTSLCEINTDVKIKATKFVGESVFMKSVELFIGSKLQNIADARYDNIEYYYGQLKQMKAEIDTTSIQANINKYNGYIAQYQTELTNYKQELEDAQAANVG